MPKILFIEDELTSNVESIIRLFAPVIPEDIQQKLKSTSFDFPEDIASLCSQNSPLDIAFSFPLALTKIIANLSDYDLILIDRNLEKSPYDKELEQICSQLHEFGMIDAADQMLKHVYKDREGDLLVQVLVKKDPNAWNRTYLVTANVLDALRGSETLLALNNTASFPKDHIIEKGSPQEEKIPQILSDMPSLKIQNEFFDQCAIIRKRLGEDWVKKFCKMIQYYRDREWDECILFLRMLLGNEILKGIALQMNEPNAPYWKNENKSQLVGKTFINGKYRWNDAKKQSDLYSGLPYIQRTFKQRGINFGYNSVIKNACLSIYEICSDCIHGDFDNFEQDVSVNSEETSTLTRYTMRSMLNQICDVIVWYNKALDVISKRS
jgi:hypothetical protein